jgi:hypothetical protein
LTKSSTQSIMILAMIYYFSRFLDDVILFLLYDDVIVVYY